jgi:GntR family transcriptional regulator
MPQRSGEHQRHARPGVVAQNGASIISTMLWTIDPLSRLPLQEQIAGCVRRAVAEDELAVGEQLPPAAELAEALGVDRNTVLAAYRKLRDDGVLEFRRGRGARVASTGRPRASVEQAARDLVELARRQGYGRADLIKILEELA